MEYRVGIGYDIHRLVAERKLFIGGVEIPYVLGLLGHSDADVLLHAVCDALLGAASLGDIGELFPDTDPQYSGINSMMLVKEVMQRVKALGFRVGNIDLVVIAQKPSLVPFKQQIRQSIAAALEIADDRVSVKAKTNEGLDATGRSEAIASFVSVILIREG